MVGASSLRGRQLSFARLLCEERCSSCYPWRRSWTDAAQADGLDAHLTLDVCATSRLRPCKQQRERSARGHNRAKNFVLGEPASGLA